jgi:hypothetical protein
MGYRTGDTLVIQMGKRYVRLNPRDSMQLEHICLDQEKEDALRFLDEIVYRSVMCEEAGASSNSELQELERIVKQQDADSALRFLSEVVYKKAAELMRAPGCKPVFELPKAGTPPQVERLPKR